MISPELITLIEDASGVDAEDLTREANLAELGISSLSMIEVAVRVEDIFGVHVGDEAALKIKTLGDLQDYINSHAGSGTKASEI